MATSPFQRAQESLARLRDLIHECRLFDSQTAREVRLGVATPFANAMKGDLVLAYNDIKGRTSAPSSGHFVGHLDAENGVLRVEHTGDESFWLSVRLPEGALAPHCCSEEEHPAATLYTLRRQELDTKREAFDRLVEDFKADLASGRAALFDASAPVASDCFKFQDFDALHPRETGVVCLSSDGNLRFCVYMWHTFDDCIASAANNIHVPQLVRQHTATAPYAAELVAAQNAEHSAEDRIFVDGSDGDDLMRRLQTCCVDLHGHGRWIHRGLAEGREYCIKLDGLVESYMAAKYRPSGPAVEAVFLE
jgi:hypothetical protein